MGAKTTIRSIATLLLIALFTFSGIAKLMPFPSADFHGEMKYQFKSRFARVFPLAGLGIIPDPDIYRVSVGILEVACALLLIAGTPRAKLYSLYVLLIVMIGALYTHIALHDEVKEMGGAIVAIILILTRLTLDGVISVKAKVN